MSFKKNKYIVIKEAVPKEIADILFTITFYLKELLQELYLIKGIYLNSQRNGERGQINKFQTHIRIMQI